MRRKFFKHFRNLIKDYTDAVNRNADLLVIESYETRLHETIITALWCDIINVQTYNRLKKFISR